jgi:uncharacterized protein YeaO (DUF488 family)
VIEEVAVATSTESPGSGHDVRIARVREPRTAAQGFRILVDRLWPRGLSKDRADLDGWCRGVAPSTELRRSYGHDAVRFAEFADRYRADEQVVRLRRLAALAAERPLTLLTATAQVAISHAVVLEEALRAYTSCYDRKCAPP